ncbi:MULTISPECIES: SMP-30/gluconolactonase/LRE family protein [unclassified Mycobacterium]|uniref:SMP-30/gluconolactonase/LRE family protein n=1 Tax=unclassified Mycobacterium TaxID=2642494 RepID=UPI0007FF72A4|nr:MULTISPECIES: SMP-30/gluconolactonase/LRE family protein [unclassified Mycobacterium]OBG58202.1 gluconolaconase [Mycobacterium sp. E3339]OBH90243.1 gluconolaconase [Mycobacterium sp. E2989]
MSAHRRLAEGLSFPESPVVYDDGSVVVSEMAAGRITRVRPDGVTETVAETGGGPNGVARLPDGRLVVCQNGGSTFGLGPWPYDFAGCATLFRPVGPPDHPVLPALQLVEAGGQVSTLFTEFVTRSGSTVPLMRPSDICVDGDGGFYVTDGGATRDRNRSMTGLLYGTVDGMLREIVYPLEMPNGVALSPDGTLLYVAETRTRRIWEFTLDGPGAVSRARGLATVPSGGPLNIGGADGLCVDAAGRILVATLGTGGLTVISPTGELLGTISADDPMTTNVALSRDGETLFMTLASSGRLVMVENWREHVGAAQASP